jgi:hypothetical protein
METMCEQALNGTRYRDGATMNISQVPRSRCRALKKVIACKKVSQLVKNIN